MKSYAPLLIVLLLIAAITVASADSADIEAMGFRAGQIGLAELGLSSGDSSLLCLTDAGYAEPNGISTERALTGIYAATECSYGMGNLYRNHMAFFDPLFFFFFDKGTGKAVYLAPTQAAYGMNQDEIQNAEDSEIFTIKSAVIDADYLIKNQDVWNQIISDGIFGGNEFRLITFANTWANPAADHAYLEASAFHNHICPGITSGMIIADYVESKLPIETPKQHYKVIATPNWCKEDYFQTVWDATPGISRLFAMKLDADEQASLEEKFGARPAGIYIRWDDETQTGTGLVLTYDWNKTYELCGVPDWSQLISKLIMDIGMLSFSDNPSEVISTVKEFELTSIDEFNALVTAGTNPYEELGLLP